MNDKRTKDEKFESIYTSCADDVYRACRHLTTDDSLAQDMAQQAFLNFYERMDKLDLEYAKAYIIRAARNLLYNYYRDTKKEQMSDGEDEEFKSAEPIIGSVEDGYFEEMKRSMMGNFTREILEDLKENHQVWYEVILMICIQDMHHEEVARKLNITKDVLYSRLHRAKLWIRKKYGDKLKEITD